MSLVPYMTDHQCYSNVVRIIKSNEISDWTFRTSIGHPDGGLQLSATGIAATCVEGKIRKPDERREEGCSALG